MYSENMGKDYYDVLGVAKNASNEEIKSAYKKLAKKYHPDVSSEANAEEKFKEVQEAYSVLGDSTKRANFDKFGDAAERFSGFRDFGQRDFSHFEFDFGDIFSDFGGSPFGDIFGSGFGRRGPVRGQDIIVKVNVSFEEAAFGTEKEIEIERTEKCGSCKGSGAKKGSGKVTCETCKGSGMQRSVKRTIIGTIATAHTCPKCKGSGKVVKDPCSECSGKGILKAKRKIEVKIPAGINTGNNLRLNGEGNAGDDGAEHGDLYVAVFVEPHEIFRRDGADIFAEMPLSFSEAALGTEVDVPTLEGKASMKIPEGTESGTVFKMKGKGIKVLGGSGKGDEFVKVFIKTPQNLSKKERELFEELSKHDEVKSKREGLFDRIKKHFE
jgi:molecular chaperone DnaJ